MDATLEERIAALEARLEAVERAKQTMKERRSCPACGSAKLLRTAHVPADISSGAPPPFALSANQPLAGGVKTKGVFEVHACTGCGLVEWHALELEPSILDDPRIERVNPPADEERKTPYR